MKKLKIIFSGGGTGGHIFPAVSIANAIKEEVPDAEILFVGALGKMEMEKVPAAGYKIIGLPIAGIQRKFSLANFKFPFLLLKSILQARKIIKEFKPDVAVGTGGYASGPLLRAAIALSVPTLIQEQNSFAGLTNKWLGKKVTKICVAYEGMENFFPKEKILITGNPVRQDLFNSNIKREDAFSFFKLDPTKKTIVVIGGSLGAKGINEAMIEGLVEITSNNFQLIWQTGKPFFEKASQKIAEHKSENIKVFDFISKMDFTYSVADVIISRAGAGAVSEICLAKKASILVPLPTAAEDHQTKNAMALVKKNAALIVKDNEAKSNLIQTVINLLNNQELIRQLETNCGLLAQPNSSNLIANEILKLAGYKS